MVVRIVKMTFQKDLSSQFQVIFNQSKASILAMEGCSHLELLQDVAQPHIFITYSYWESETHLNAYRRSDFFRTIWPKTKILFSEPAVAHTLTREG
jgi:quinol monooxygenase YgiN